MLRAAFEWHTGASGCARLARERPVGGAEPLRCLARQEKPREGLAGRVLGYTKGHVVQHPSRNMRVRAGHTRRLRAASTEAFLP